jgi:hypothetical protein
MRFLRGSWQLSEGMRSSSSSRLYTVDEKLPIGGSPCLVGKGELIRERVAELNQLEVEPLEAMLVFAEEPANSGLQKL